MKIKTILITLLFSLSIPTTPLHAYTKNDLETVHAYATLANLVGILAGNYPVRAAAIETQEIINAALEPELQHLSVNLISDLIWAVALGTLDITPMHSHLTWQKIIAGDQTDSHKTLKIGSRVLRTLVRTPLMTAISNSKSLKSNRLMRRAVRASLLSITSTLIGALETYIFTKTSAHPEEAWQNFGIIAGSDCALNIFNEALGELLIQSTEEAILMKDNSYIQELEKTNAQVTIAPEETTAVAAA